MTSVYYSTPFDLPSDIRANYFQFLPEQDQLACSLVCEELRESLLSTIEKATKDYLRDSDAYYHSKRSQFSGTSEQDYVLRQIEFYREHLPGQRPHFYSLNRITLKDRVGFVDFRSTFNVDELIQLTLNQIVQIDGLPSLRKLSIRGRNIPEQLLFHLIKPKITPRLKKVGLYQCPSINRAFLSALSKRQIPHLLIDGKGIRLDNRVYPDLTLDRSQPLRTLASLHQPLPFQLTDYSQYQMLQSLALYYINNLTEEVTQHIGASLPYLHTLKMGYCEPITVQGYHNLFRGARSLLQVSFKESYRNIENEEERSGALSIESAMAISPSFKHLEKTPISRLH